MTLKTNNVQLGTNNVTPTKNIVLSNDETTGDLVINKGNHDGVLTEINRIKNDGTVSNLSASSGASLVGYMPAGVGAVATNVQSKLRESVSVLDFYANGVSGVAVDPTGVVDSTLGFQAAIAASKKVYIPSGTYRLSSTINLAGVSLIGDDIVNTVLMFYGTAITCVNMGGGAHMEDLVVNGSNTSNSTGILTGSTLANNMTARNVRVRDFTGVSAIGIYIRDAVGVFFSNVYSILNYINLKIQGTTGSLPTYMKFTGCAFREATTAGVFIARGYGITFDHCLFEQNIQEGVKVSVLDIVEGLYFVNGCWFERNWEADAAQYQAVFDGSAGGAQLKDVTLSQSFFYQGVPHAARFSKSTGTTVRENILPNAAGIVLFDTNSSGWIESQPYASSTVLVDATGFMRRSGQSIPFTPTIDGNTVAGAGTYTTQSGTYSRVGNTVYVNVSLTWTAHTGTGTGMRIGGLPFVSATGAIAMLSGVVSNVTLTAGSSFSGAQVRASSLQADLYQAPTGGGAIALIPIDTAGMVSVSGFYYVP